jgi:hypothetical protein
MTACIGRRDFITLLGSAAARVAARGACAVMAGLVFRLEATATYRKTEPLMLP